MRHLEIWVEEPSAEAALLNLVPKIVGKCATFSLLRVVPGKPSNEFSEKRATIEAAFLPWFREQAVRKHHNRAVAAACAIISLPALG